MRDSADQIPAASGTIPVLAKLVFISSFILQVVIWPSAMTIVASSTYALFELGSLAACMYKRKGRGALMDALRRPGVFLLRWRPKHGDAANYILMLFMGLYFMLFFGMFIGHEMDVEPAATLWIPTGALGNTSLEAQAAMPFDVTSAESAAMRASPFVWERHIDAPLPRLIGAAAGLVCATDAALAAKAFSYACYVKGIMPAPPADSHFDYPSPPLVPLPHEYYHVDVLVTPPAGVPCAALEVYRTVLDEDRNVLVGIDYPSSTSGQGYQRAQVFPPRCGIFNDSSWCLKFGHTFTAAQYDAEIAAQCAAGKGSLRLRLPSRADEVDLATGQLNADVLLVTAGATVEVHAGWRSSKDGGPSENADAWTWAPFKQVAWGDAAQPWRESSDATAVFFKFFFAAAPVLHVWYYLASEFQVASGGHQAHHGRPDGPQPQLQVPLLCVFVLLPAALLFLSVGAWLPMAGCIVSALGVNVSMKGAFYKRFVRPAMLALSAACNSIQLVWLLALIAQTGLTAFYYEGTLRQLFALSDRFIVSDTASPTWMAIATPCVLALNAAFVLVAALCVVLEIIASYFSSTTAAGAT